MTSNGQADSIADTARQDRRDFMRLGNGGTGLLRVRGSELPVRTGRIIDISANGLSLLCDAAPEDALSVGTEVEVIARLDDMDDPFFLVGDIAWSQPEGDRTKLGIELPAPNGDHENVNDNRDWRALFLA
ncbi:MAG: PilZ domain-containing protein [Pseudomonadota bacterium]